MTGSKPNPSGHGADTPTDLTCPTCHGILRGVSDVPLPMFRCRTGHQFSIESLIPAMEQDVEDGLWTALRVLEEAIDAEHEFAETLRNRGDEDHAREAEGRADRHRRQIESVRAAIETE